MAVFVTLAVLFALPVGFCLLAWNFERWPFDLEKLGKLTDASTQQEVVTILGRPRSSSVRTNQNGEICHEWVYARPLSFPIVYIHFDPDGTYSTNVCDE